jgi:hypothetical protein
MSRGSAGCREAWSPKGPLSECPPSNGSIAPSPATALKAPIAPRGSSAPHRRPRSFARAPDSRSAPGPRSCRDRPSLRRPCRPRARSAPAGTGRRPPRWPFGAHIANSETRPRRARLTPRRPGSGSGIFFQEFRHLVAPDFLVNFLKDVAHYRRSLSQRLSEREQRRRAALDPDGSG